MKERKGKNQKWRSTRKDYRMYHFTGKETAKYLLEGAAVCAVADYLFYQSLPVLLFMLPIPVLFLKMQRKKCTARQQSIWCSVLCIFYARRSTSIKRSRRIFRRDKRRVSRSFFNEKHPAALKLRGSPYQVKFYSTSVWMRRSNSVMSKMRSLSERSRVTLLAQSRKISRMTGTSFSPLSVT